MPSNWTHEVSVIIATRDRAGPLARTLSSLSRQEVGRLAWQVLVVDNGSSDSTRDVIDSFKGRLPLIGLNEPTPGKSRALNVAKAHWGGRLLLFTDDDVEMTASWVMRMVAASRRWPQANIFGGRIVPTFPAGTPDWTTDLTLAHGRWAFSAYHPRETEGPTHETPLGPNMAIRAHVLEDIFWDETLGPGLGPWVPMGEEVDLLVRLQRRGEPFIFVPDCRVHHILPQSHLVLANLRLRAFRAGIDDARLYSSAPPTYPLFGIPVHLWQTLVGHGLRYFVRLPRRTALRHDSSFRLRRVLGHIWGFVDMKRSGRLSGPTRSFPTTTALLHALRKFVLLGIVRARKALALTESVAFFETALPSDLHSEETVEVFKAPDDLVRAIRMLGPLSDRLSPEEIERRLRAGDSVSVASQNGHAVGYAWATTRRLPVDEVQLEFEPGDGQVIGYDIFVTPALRGTGIAGDLDRAQMCLSVSRGLRSQILWVALHNHDSLRAMARLQKRLIGTVHVLRPPFSKRPFSWTEANGAKTRRSRQPDGMPHRPLADELRIRGRMISTISEDENPDCVPPPTT